MRMAFRILNALMALIFLMAVVVQYNDPDPLLWMAIYGAAFVISVLVWRRGRVHPAAPVLVGVAALAWSVAIMLGGPGGANYLHMFDAWEMQSVNVEQAREATGLLIVAAWMAVLAFRGKGL
jgi:glucan phosphoethanolaminetransferase (alkaline phosphatase superfamily)